MAERNFSRFDVPQVVDKSIKTIARGAHFVGRKASEFAHDHPRETIVGITEIVILAAGGKVLIDQANHTINPSSEPQKPGFVESPPSQREIIPIDGAKLSEIVTTFNKQHDLLHWENNPPQGGCLGGVNDVLEDVYPQMGSEKPLRNPAGITTAIKALKEMTKMGEFEQIKISSIKDIEKLPDGTIIGMTPSYEGWWDNAPEGDAGHIGFKLTDPNDPSQVLLGSDGVAPLYKYVEEMPDSVFVAFVPIKQNQNTESIGPVEPSSKSQELMEDNTAIVENYKKLVETRKYQSEIVSMVTEAMKLSPPDENENSLGSDERSQREIGMMASLEATMGANVQDIFDVYPGAKQYFVDLGNGRAKPGDILYALTGSVTTRGREVGMSILGNMIEQNELLPFGLPRLNQDVIRDVNGNVINSDHDEVHFALRHGIDPTALAINKYARTIAIEILKTDAKQQNVGDGFFETLTKEQEQERLSNLGRTMPNAAIVTALQQYETGSRLPYFNPTDEERTAIGEVHATVHIGDGPIYDQWNESDGQYPTAPLHMDNLTQILEEQTGFPFYKYRKNLPGSLQRSTDSSGGAFGPQAMPPYGDLYEKKYIEMNKLVGDKFPAFTLLDPISQGIFYNLYLGGEVKQRQGYIDRVTGKTRDQIDDTYYKGGYKAGTPKEDDLAPGGKDRRLYSLERWNNYDPEVNTVFEIGKDYSVKEVGK